MMRECHHSNSSKTMPKLQESMKKKLYTSFPGETDFLSDYYARACSTYQYFFVIDEMSYSLKIIVSEEATNEKALIVFSFCNIA